MNIFDYAQKYMHLMYAIEEQEGEIFPEQEEELTATLEDVEAKVKAYYGLIQLNKAKAATLKDEVERLNAKIKALENLEKRLKEYAKFAVDTFGHDDPKTGTRKLKYDDLLAYIRKVDVLNWSEEDQAVYEEKVRRLIADTGGLLFDCDYVDVDDEIVHVSLKGLTVNEARMIKSQFPDAITQDGIDVKTYRTKILNKIKGVSKENYPDDIPETVSVKKSESIIFK